MSLSPPHEHQWRRYQVRSQKQWNCIVPFCKAYTRNPLDILGREAACPKCKKFFRVEKEDLSQKTDNLHCPECNKDADPNRLLVMMTLNDAARDKAIQLIANEAMPSGSRGSGGSKPESDYDSDLAIEIINSRLQDIIPK